jgi:hypothetical protein
MVWRRFFQRKTLTGIEARQGYLDRPVLVVLTVSLTVAYVTLGLLVAFGVLHPIFPWS